MKSIVFLNGLLLLFLIHHWTESVEGQEMNLTTLAQIIDFFEENYADTTEESYAVAINVPRNQCQGKFDPSNESFLTQEKDVKNAIYKTTNKFYKGSQVPVNTEVLAQMIQYFDVKLMTLKYPNEDTSSVIMEYMVFAVPQRILLICLLHFSTCAVGRTVNQITLMNIIKNSENHVQPHTKAGTDAQYAIAIIVPQDHCTEEGSDIQTVFSKQDAETKSVVFLNGLLLLFLLHHWTESVEGQEMNLMTLARIIDFIEKNYADTKHESYAVAINVPRNQCEWNFDPSNFLTQDKDVKNGIYNTENKFYNGYSKPCIIDLINIL
ncbi:paired box Pax-3 [Labeo rohita]|uniref:Paired box Pax-3 n=1 Tax=Labeo rohita TaxID=84645 RepID=A0A498M2S7_LABRO|nr:paired box Pax-3 [Labeo rohita]